MISTVQQKKSFQWLYQFSGWTNMFAILTLLGPLFPLFCDSLHMSKTRIGFVLSLLPLSYLLSMFISRWVMRYGPKKTTIDFYFIRYGFVLLLPLAGWIMVRLGDHAAFLWVAMVVFFFSISRAIAETGWWPWFLELISPKVRGKVEAVNSMVATFAAMLASLAAVFIMKNWPGLLGFNVAIVIGVAFGFIGLATAGRLPGGQPQAVEKRNWSLLADTFETLRNPRYGIWLKGSVFFIIGTSCFGFLPLYLSERIGFTADKIMLFSGCFQIGVLASAFFWGWSADRFGSKPVFMSALAGLSFVPVLLFLLPRMDQQSVAGTCLIYAFFGIVLQGWGAGANRYFFVTVLPAAHSPAFCTALNASLQNALVACCSFFYGWLLDFMSPVKFDWRFIHFDNFAILFALMLLCLLVAFFIFRKAHNDSGVRTGEFVSLFLQGNPFLAFSSMVRFHLSEDETRRMELTRKMGDAKSHLTVEELMRAADDPSFNVRYEAIVSMARMPPDEKLIRALSAAVRSREPGLSEAAVWALGRIRDPRALPVLREMLTCEFALIRSQCARALAKLNDQEIVPVIEEAFAREKNDNISAGYAAALGRFRRSDLLPRILELLRRLSDEHLRGEAALSVARIIGGEHHFVGLWHASRSDFETACAEELIKIRQKISGRVPDADKYRQAVAAAARCFEQRNLPEGAAAVAGLLRLARPQSAAIPAGVVLAECEEMLAKHGGTRGDYILLALCAFHAALAHAAKNKLSS
ncbi:MAG: MFS transporter [Kiritimatiellia bacterium]